MARLCLTYLSIQTLKLSNFWVQVGDRSRMVSVGLGVGSILLLPKYNLYCSTSETGSRAPELMDNAMVATGNNGNVGIMRRLLEQV